MAYQAALFSHVSGMDAGARSWVTGYAMVVREETFGQLLRRAREDAGYTQESFAEAVGLSRKTVQTIERTQGRPKIENEVAVVTRMALALGLSVSELSTKLGWVPVEEAKPQSWEHGLDRDAIRIVSDLASHLRSKAPDPAEHDPPGQPHRPQRAV